MSEEHSAEKDAGLPVHAKGDGWLTICGQDRANVRHWTDDPNAVTCQRCRPIPSGNGGADG